MLRDIDETGIEQRRILKFHSAHSFAHLNGERTCEMSSGITCLYRALTVKHGWDAEREWKENMID